MSIPDYDKPPPRRDRLKSDPEDRYRDWLEKKASTAKLIVEVGVLAGKTTKRMADATKGVVYAVDHWKGVPPDPLQQRIYPNMKKSEERFRWLLADHIESGRVVPLKMSSTTGAKHLMETVGPEFDLVFIDADHRYRPVVRDIRAWLPIVRPGGWLVGHDINWPGVIKAVKQELPGFRRGPGTLWVWKVAAPE